MKVIDGYGNLDQSKRYDGKVGECGRKYGDLVLFD